MVCHTAGLGFGSTNPWQHGKRTDIPINRLLIGLASMRLGSAVALLSKLLSVERNSTILLIYSSYDIWLITQYHYHIWHTDASPTGCNTYLRVLSILEHSGSGDT